MGRLRYAGTLLGELWQFARAHKAYWIVPLVLLLLLVGGVIAIGQATAPYIYTLF